MEGLFFERRRLLKKVLNWSVLLYVIYAICISWYLYYGANTEIPNMYKGTAADPQVFMDERQIKLSYEYSRMKQILFFLVTPFEWLVLFSIIVLGIHTHFRKWSESVTRFRFLQQSIFVFWLSLLTTVVMLPINWVSYQISKNYGISTLTFSSWMKDNMIDFWINYFLMTIVAVAIYSFIRKSKKKWWFYAWILSIPFSFFLMFIQPVIIAPLYNDFYPLKDKELEEKILNMASKADIPADHVFEVNMSEKTNALNAYVTGIGENSRIVLWDTTLKALNEQEILFVMAHEMAHYVKHHIYIGIAGYLILSLFGLFITAKLLKLIIYRWGEKLKINYIQDIASLPLLLLIFSMLSFAVSPFSNAFSRHLEHTADEYAIEMTQDTDAAVRTFQKLTVAGLNEVNPPLIVKWFRYGHPTMLERIYFLEEYNKK